MNRRPTGVPELRGTRTHENLEHAFALDARAAQLCARFARVAEIEGFPQLSRVLREVAEAQGLFAGGHLDFLVRAGDPLTGGPLGESAANARAAMAAQLADAENELPEMAATARAEGFPDIASWFDTMASARKAHAERLRAAGAG
jgi:rubrerythrin